MSGAGKDNGYRELAEKLGTVEDLPYLSLFKLHWEKQQCTQDTWDDTKQKQQILAEAVILISSMIK